MKDVLKNELLAEYLEPQVDPALKKYYSLGKEIERLDVAFIEKERTLRILKKRMPQPPAVVLDIGGAYGVYAFPLAQLGYEVHLIDPIAIHIEQAQEYAKKNSPSKLASYSIGDARKIDRKDNSADVILFLGPLYHLILSDERLQALNEAYRILKPGGILFAATISRFQSFIDNTHKGLLHFKTESVIRDLLSGLHESEKSNMCLYFHHPHELKEELVKCKFTDITILGIEGPVWQQDLILNLQKEPKEWEQLLDLLELIEKDEAIVGASAHIMAIAKK